MKPTLAWIIVACVTHCGSGVAEVTKPAHADARYSEEDFLPVESKALSPGAVQSRRLEAAGLPAFFLVGDDSLSRAWLKRNTLRLTKLNAVGLVVNVRSTSALENLRQLAPQLTLSPVAADDLAHRLNLDHYPVLITADSVEQ